MASIELSPGVVVDLDTATGYVMDPEGGISAINLSDGGALWRSGDADRPLLMSGDLLVSQADAPGVDNELRLVMLRTADGGSVATEGRLAMPAGVQPAAGQGADRSFTLRAEPADGDAVINWEFRERAMRGISDEPDEVLPGEELPEDATGGPAPMDRSVAPPSEQDTVYRGQARLSPADGSVAQTAEPRVEREAPRLARSAIQPPAEEPDDAGAAPTDPAEPRFLSRDGRHLLVSERVADDREWDNYRWRIIERDSGQEIGTIRSHQSYAPFVVAEGKVIQEIQPYERLVGGEVSEEPLQIRAFDLETGEQVWARPVRDDEDGPPPPP